MRKIVMFNMISLDGFFAGEDGNIDWHVTDKEFDRMAIEMHKDVDTVLFGRVTYELFESYWPIALKDPATSADDRKVAQLIQDARKIVFSKSLKKVTWNNAELHKTMDPEFIKQLKKESGGTIIIWGSGTVVQQLTKSGLIDEYRVMTNPVVLGEGKRLFGDKTFKLNLVKTVPFTSGNVLLYYHPTKA